MMSLDTELCSDWEGCNVWLRSKQATENVTHYLNKELLSVTPDL